MLTAIINNYACALFFQHRHVLITANSKLQWLQYCANQGRPCLLHFKCEELASSVPISKRDVTGRRTLGLNAADQHKQQLIPIIRSVGKIVQSLILMCKLQQLKWIIIAGKVSFHNTISNYKHSECERHQGCWTKGKKLDKNSILAVKTALNNFWAQLLVALCHRGNLTLYLEGSRTACSLSVEHNHHICKRKAGLWI